MSVSDISGYSELFFKTADEHITQIEEGLREVMHSANPNELTEEIYRHVHSLKGSSSVMGYNAISSICTKLGDILHPDATTYTITEQNFNELTNLMKALKEEMSEIRRS